MIVGHIVMGERGEMTRLDAGFCSIMRAPAEALLGRSVLDVTVPDDRAVCRQAMRRLAATSEPFQVIKRMLRGDDTKVWVSQTVAPADFGDSPRAVLATVVPLDPDGTRGKPGFLLDYARTLRDSRRARGVAFDTRLFSEPAWDLLLSAYIVEAEGGLFGAAALADAAGVGGTVAIRWARALLSEGLLEIESRHTSSATSEPHYRLTDRAHEKFERYMTHRLHGIVGAMVDA